MRTIRRAGPALVAAALTAIVGAGATATATAAPPTADPAALQAALDDVRAADAIPGVAAAVVVDGRVAWTGASGLAVDRRGIHARTGARTVARSVPATPATRFSIASLSKVYTATLVLRLAQDGRIGLDDPIARHLSPAPPGGDQVTVRQLLDHTAGYADVENRGELADQLDLTGAYDPARRYDLARILAAVRAPHFPPGSRFEYSNTNYLLLGAILTTVSGGSLDSELQRVVAGPLGLAATSFADRPGLARRTAHGYERDGRRLIDHWSGSRTLPTDLVGPVWADGGVVTTAAEAARFGDALARGRILTPELRAQMIAPTAVSGEDLYGLGSYRWDVAGRRWDGHDGNYGGYQSVMFSAAADGVTVAVLTNDDGGGVWDAFRALADTL